jgi:hypothetical protein
MFRCINLSTFETSMLLIDIFDKKIDVYLNKFKKKLYLCYMYVCYV